MLRLKVNEDLLEINTLVPFVAFCMRTRKNKEGERDNNILVTYDPSEVERFVDKTNFDEKEIIKTDKFFAYRAHLLFDRFKPYRGQEFTAGFNRLSDKVIRVFMLYESSQIKSTLCGHDYVYKNNVNCSICYHFTNDALVYFPYTSNGRNTWKDD